MKASFVLTLALAAIGSAALGFWFGRSSAIQGPAPSKTVETPPDVREPSEAIARFASAVVRWKGPFQDPLDQLDAKQKLDVYKDGVLRLGKTAFEPAVNFLGDPVQLAANMSLTAASPGGVNGNATDRGMPAMDPIVREAVLELLPRLDPERAAPELAQRLQDDDESGRVRARAAGELAHLNREVAIPALVEALDVASERAWNGARSIVESMAVLGGPEVSEALLQAFQRPSTSQELRIAVTQSLGAVKFKDAVPALENVVRHENRDHYVRREAIRALLRIDPERAYTLTLEQIDRETDAAFKSFLQDVAKTRGKLR